MLIPLLQLHSALYGASANPKKPASHGLSVCFIFENKRFASLSSHMASDLGSISGLVRRRKSKYMDQKYLKLMPLILKT